MQPGDVAQVGGLASAYSAVQAQAVVVGIILGGGSIGASGEGSVHVGQGCTCDYAVVVVQVGTYYYAVVLGVIVCTGQAVYSQAADVFLIVDVVGPQVLIQGGVFDISQVVGYSTGKQVTGCVQAMLNAGQFGEGGGALHSVHLICFGGVDGIVGGSHKEIGGRGGADKGGIHQVDVVGIAVYFAGVPEFCGDGELGFTVPFCTHNFEQLVMDQNVGGSVFTGVYVPSIAFLYIASSYCQPKICKGGFLTGT